MCQLNDFPIAYSLSNDNHYPDTIKHIFPVMQQDVQNILDYLNTNKTNITKVIVFGSSITYNCGVGSDLDLAFQFSEPVDEALFLKSVKPIRMLIKNKCDLVCKNEIYGTLLDDEIDRKGYIIYEQS